VPAAEKFRPAILLNRRDAGNLSLKAPPTLPLEFKRKP
jgi:hypothetical protein